MRDHCRHAHSVRAASSVRADMIFGKDKGQPLLFLIEFPCSNWSRIAILSSRCHPNRQGSARDFYGKAGQRHGEDEGQRHQAERNPTVRKEAPCHRFVEVLRHICFARPPVVLRRYGSLILLNGLVTAMVNCTAYPRLASEPVRPDSAL